MFGIITGLVLLMLLAYRGHSIIWVAPLAFSCIIGQALND
jgi:hypothetical protein